jgi:hypothetical protein
MRRFWVITEPRDTSTMQGIWLCTWEDFVCRHFPNGNMKRHYDITLCEFVSPIRRGCQALGGHEVQCSVSQVCMID